MKNKLVVRELEESDEQAFFAGLKDWEGEALNWYTFDWKEGMSFAELLTIMRNHSKGVNLSPGFVPATMFYGFIDDEIVGRVHVRHLLNDYLRSRGGHIGYAVAPRFRGRGYATEMVKQILPICRSLGIKKILITCADDNLPSIKIIERIGGVLENKVWNDQDKEVTRRYWVG